MDKDDVYLLRSEAGILKTLDHENIVKFKHVCQPLLLTISDKRDWRKDTPGHGDDEGRVTH